MSFEVTYWTVLLIIDVYLVYRNLDEKEKNLREAFQRIQILEREIAARDAEVTYLVFLCSALKWNLIFCR